MANVSNYYIESKDKLISDKDSYIIGKKYRFTVLSPRLIRLEYNPNGTFVDSPSALVINRKFPKVNYNITESETLLEINTGVFTLTYAKDKELKSSTLNSNIKAVLNNTKIEWQMNSPEAKNLYGINYSIDSVKDNIVLDKGLYSLDGYTVINDNTPILDQNDTFIERSTDSKDIYLFLYNNDFEGCLSDYFTLTGYPNMIPRYALGTWWYKNENYKQEDIVDLVTKFNNDNIPLSVFILGDNWHKDSSYTPSIDLKNVSDYLKQNNIKLGVTINPKLNIEKGSNEYNLISNYVNSDKINFIPFSNEKIGIYLNLFINNLENIGVNIFSIDYNNPMDRINLWKICHYHSGKKEITNNRSLVLTRNHGVAPHRYPIIWSGKTKVNWRTFALLPRYNLQGYNAGISFIAHPIGGYSGGIEDDELFLRYIEFACFSPIFLMASEGGKYYKREPWKWNSSNKDTITTFINLRYKLIPYLYSESYDYHKTGHGIIKPFYYDYPKVIDEPLYKSQYFFGKNFFVAPITTKKNPVINRVMKKVFVPNGIWFNFFDGKQYTGNKYYNNFYRDKDYPVFVKAGSIIPMNYNIKDDIPKTLELNIYPLDNDEYILYEDDGISNNYKKGLYMTTKYNYTYAVDNYTFTITRGEGKNLINNRNYILRFKNTRNVNEVIINDTTIKYSCYYDKNDFVVVINNLIVGRDISINIKGKDMMVSSVRLINEEIKEILYDLSLDTDIKEKLDEILFSDLDIKKKRIKIRKLKSKKFDKNYIKIFINLLEYIQKI